MDAIDVSNSSALSLSIRELSGGLYNTQDPVVCGDVPMSSSSLDILGRQGA